VRPPLFLSQGGDARTGDTESRLGDNGHPVLWYPMDDLTARLESLFRRYAAAMNQRHGDHAPVAKQFLEEADLLITQYGQPAVEAALDTPDVASPSVSLH
jgi:hypothetical protein